MPRSHTAVIAEGFELLHHELVAAELDLMREVIIGNQKHSEAISGR